jgi:hypothetical protein
MHITTVGIEFHADDPIEGIDTGTVAIGGAWMYSGEPDAWERLAAEALSAANALRVPGGAA